MRANFGQADTLGSRRWGRPAVWLLTCALLWSPLVLADKDGDIDIRSAFTEVVDDVYYLNGRVELALSADALKALENGVALNIEFQIEVSQRRRYIWDSTVASLRQRYELAFHALTGRFVLANRNSGERESFSTLSGALARVGVIDDLPIIDEALLQVDARYDGNLRVEMEIKQKAGPLRVLTLFWGDWHVTSEWYRWPMQR